MSTPTPSSILDGTADATLLTPDGLLSVSVVRDIIAVVPAGDGSVTLTALRDGALRLHRALTAAEARHLAALLIAAVEAPGAPIAGERR
jgi:hypothetical protein